MRLSKSLISEFVKITNDRTKENPETTVYGSVVENGDTTYVKLDGSNILTPVTTTADVQPGERVSVLIKNHTATIYGNISSPSARTGDVQNLEHTKLDSIEAETVYATNARVDNIEAAHGEFETLTASNFETVNANISNLEATHGAFETLTAQNFEAVDAKINNLVVGDIEAVYANIDFSNIGSAAMEYFYSTSGLIENVVISDGVITGNLVGVTIKGDLIEGNTVVADKLVIKGSNGLYYKLNTDGAKIEAEQTDYNSINGSIITAKSITATKINVDDLVAFDATIGGFNITSDSLYSGVKESITNATSGIYLGNDGQISLGDSTNFLKYYKDTEGNFKLDISLGGSNVGNAIDDASKTATDFLSYDAENGLQVGNKTGGSWSGFRAQVTSTAFSILDSAGSTLASYGAKLIELGKSATDAIIKLCGGKGQIEYVTDDACLQISSDKLRLKSDSMTSIYSSRVNESDVIERSAVNVSPNETYIYSSDSNITLNTSGIALSTSGDVTVSAASFGDSHGQFLSVVESSSGIWNYKKWSNGRVELWGSYAVSGVACSAQFGAAMYRSDVLTMPSFPFSVYSPNLTASYESNGYGAFLWATSTTTESSPPSYYLVRAESGTITSGKINFHAIGNWKE